MLATTADGLRYTKNTFNSIFVKFARAENGFGLYCGRVELTNVCQSPGFEIARIKYDSLCVENMKHHTSNTYTRI